MNCLLATKTVEGNSGRTSPLEQNRKAALGHDHPLPGSQRNRHDSSCPERGHARGRSSFDVNDRIITVTNQATSSQRLQCHELTEGSLTPVTPTNFPLRSFKVLNPLLPINA